MGSRRERPARSAMKSEPVRASMAPRTAKALLGVCGEGQQHVSRVRDGGVGEQAPDAALADGDEVAEQHREGRDDCDDGDPSADEVTPGGGALSTGEADGGELEEDDEASDL